MSEVSEMQILCGWDEAFTDREMFEETNFCVNCYKLDCPYHIMAILFDEEEKTEHE